MKHHRMKSKWITEHNQIIWNTQLKCKNTYCGFCHTNRHCALWFFFGGGGEIGNKLKQDIHFGFRFSYMMNFHRRCESWVRFESIDAMWDTRFGHVLLQIPYLLTKCSQSNHGLSPVIGPNVSARHLNSDPSFFNWKFISVNPRNSERKIANFQDHPEKFRKKLGKTLIASAGC